MSHDIHCSFPGLTGNVTSQVTLDARHPIGIDRTEIAQPRDFSCPMITSRPVRPNGRVRQHAPASGMCLRAEAIMSLVAFLASSSTI